MIVGTLNGVVADANGQKFVTVSPMAGGFITLPEQAFVSDPDPTKKQTVPSMSFLITHPGPVSPVMVDEPAVEGPFHILFDLGLRKSIGNYTPEHKIHLEKRRPYHLEPGIAAQLQAGGLQTKDINLVILSHVHYDHHGDPGDFPDSTFVVGPGSISLLDGGLKETGSHQHFDPKLLQQTRTIELQEPHRGSCWKQCNPLGHMIDVFGDESVYIMDAPGHLQGHINLLCRIGPQKLICLCGDAFHDRRLLTGERNFGFWTNDDGHQLCIHSNPKQAMETLEKLRILAGHGVEVVAAHDHEWLSRTKCFSFLL